jgi:nucleoporin POM34
MVVKKYSEVTTKNLTSQHDMLEESVYEDAMNFSLAYNIGEQPNNIFETPLKKLPNNSIGDIHFKQCIDRDHILLGIDFYDEGSDIGRVENQIHSEVSDVGNNLTPLGNAPFKFYQNQATLETPRVKSPIYYKPPSSNFKDTQYGIKSFLPPNVQLIKERTNKVPLLVKYNKRERDLPRNVPGKLSPSYIQDDLSDEDLPSANPTGEWTNPIMKQALTRQINKEYYLKKLLKNVLYLIFFTLIKSLVGKIIILYLAKRVYPPVDTSQYEIIFTIASRIIVSLFVINIIISILKLIKEQDQCLDLPLSDKQRQLIGLNIQDRDDDESLKEHREEEVAELTLKQRQYQLHDQQSYKLPKYSKINGYQEEERIEITNSRFNEPSRFDSRLTDPRFDARFNDPKLDTSRLSSLNSRIQFTPTSQIGLSSSVPSNVQFLQKTQKLPTHHRISEKERETFSKHFDIEFNYGDDLTSK